MHLDRWFEGTTATLKGVGGWSSGGKLEHVRRMMLRVLLLKSNLDTAYVSLVIARVIESSGVGIGFISNVPDTN